MRPSLVAVTVLLMALSGVRAQVTPFRADSWSTPGNAIDAPVLALLRDHGAEAPVPCSDAVFLRRAHLDLIGTLPTPAETQAFLKDTGPDKRARLIDALMERDEFADYWALKWCDLLRVKSEFPINLWPNAVQAYHRWVHDAIRDGMPLDDFARALLTSSGSNFRVPPVNFYRAVQGRQPADLAAAVALTFMGTRLDTWPPEQREQMAAIFSRVAFKGTREWKEEIVYCRPATEPLKIVFPDGSRATIAPEDDPRAAFADWLLADGNEWFARNLANRAWYWLLGHGIIHEPDDIRADNPPACPELLIVLQDELVASGYDLRALFRLIMNSRTYQQAADLDAQPDPAVACARYTIRRLDAEVLADALTWLGGPGESYSSPIPEPFTFIPPEQRTIALADGSITSAFLELFGRPARDTGLESERNNEPTDAQRLYLLNSAEMGRRLGQSRLLQGLITSASGSPQRLVPAVYLAVLSRPPTPEEAMVAQQYYATGGLDMRQATIDLAWALINTKEFLYRH